MNKTALTNDIPVKLVSSVNEGRLDYIAEMAGELAKMAAEAGEHRLASTLNSAQRDAAEKAKILVKR